MREVERKFRVSSPFLLPDLAAGVAGVAGVAGPKVRRLDAIYHDTPDLRLAREQVTLRYRSTDGGAGSWQLKLPVLGGTAGVRDELDAAGGPDELPERFAGLVRVHVRGSPLGPVARLLTERSALELLGPAGEPLAEVVDDTVEARDGSDHVAARFREVEVEDTGGGAPVLQGVAEVLLGAGAVEGEFTPKVVRALGLRATQPPEVAPPLDRMPPKAPAADLLRATLARHTRHLMAHDPLVRLGTDDAVHQMRVAARRLRTTLRLFAPLLDAEWRAQLDGELSWLGQVLGEARDAEVLTARLAAALDEVPVELVRGPVAARLLGELTARGARAVERVGAALDEGRYLCLVDALVAAAVTPPLLDGAERPAGAVLPDLLARADARLRKRADAVLAAPSAAGYHAARIAAKRARYAAEAAATVAGKPAERYAKLVAGVQDVLGEEHDAVTTAELLAQLAATPAGRAVGFTLGVLHAGQTAAATAARARFAKMWPEVSRRRHRRWMES